MHDVEPAGGGPVCYWHHSAPAVARCVSCGRNICSDCSVMMQGRNYCRYCSDTSIPPYYPTYQPPVKKKWYSFLLLKGPPPFQGVNWQVWEAIVIYIVAFILTVGAGEILIRFFSETLTTESLILFMLLMQLVQYGTLTVGVYVSVKLVHHSSISEVGLNNKGIGRGLALGIGFGFPLWAGAIMLSYFSQIFFKHPESFTARTMTEVSEGGVSPIYTIIMIFILVVLAPVFEELFFRGYLYPALRNHMGMQPAMLLDGFLFALVHWELLGFLSRMLVGYGLSFIFEKNRNLAGPIIGHAIYNGVIVAVLLVFSMLL